jgi:hypothetical protein
MHGRAANPGVMERYSLGMLCSDARRAARIPPCRTYNTFSMVILASCATGGVGLLLLGGIMAVGAVARRRRRALVTLFRPVLYVVTATLVALLLVHALLGLEIVRLVALVAAVRPGALLGLLALVSLILVVGASAAAVRMARAAGGVRRVLAARLHGGLPAEWLTGARQPAVAGLVPEVFVAPPGAVSLDGPLAAESLHVPLTLARILTPPQFQALARRARFRAAEEGGAVARLLESWAAVNAEHDTTRRSAGFRRLLALPMLSVLALLLNACADAEAALERHQQVAADRAAADACGADACAVAIVKAAAFGPAWVAVVREMRDAARSGSQYVNAGELFAAIVAANADPARLSAVIHEHAATPPTAVPLRQRIERLGLSPEKVAGDALDVQPPDTAAALVGADLAAVEERLTAVAHEQLLHLR